MRVVDVRRDAVALRVKVDDARVGPVARVEDAALRHVIDHLLEQRRLYGGAQYWRDVQRDGANADHARVGERNLTPDTCACGKAVEDAPSRCELVVQLLSARDKRNKAERVVGDDPALDGDAKRKLYAEMKALGMWSNVTVLVSSEFGRTLTANSHQGTDLPPSGVIPSSLANK